MEFSLSGGAAVLRSVVIVVNDTAEGIPAGASVTLTGRVVGSGVEWSVRAGMWTADGGQRVLVDAAAPLNVPLEYTLRWDDAGTQGAVTEPAGVREYSGEDAITSLDGRSVAGFRWLKSGGASWVPQPRFTAFEVPGRAHDVLRLDPVAGAGGGSLVAQTTEPHITSFVRLIAENRVVYLFHNEARCRIPHCEVPPVSLVFFTAAPSERTPRTDRAYRSFSLTYLLQDDPEPWALIPLSTWDDFDAVSLTWDEFDGLGLTWDEFDATYWPDHA